MVETRSGRSVEPGDSPRGGSPERPARKDTATTGGQGAGTPRRRRPGGAARGEAAEPSGSTQLTTSQSYTLLALELLVFALPCIFSPKLVRRRLSGCVIFVSQAGCSLLAGSTRLRCFQNCTPTPWPLLLMCCTCRLRAPPLARLRTLRRTSTLTCGGWRRVGLWVGTAAGLRLYASRFAKSGSGCPCCTSFLTAHRPACCFVQPCQSHLPCQINQHPTHHMHLHFMQVLGLLASGLLAASAAAFALEECARRGQAYLLTFTGGRKGGWVGGSLRSWVSVRRRVEKACHAMPCHAMPCHAMPCHVDSCMACQAMSCCAKAVPIHVMNLFMS